MFYWSMPFVTADWFTVSVTSSRFSHLFCVLRSSNRMTGREFFTRFPALYPFLLQQLEETASTVER